jgi:hypothetical protein
MIATNGKQWSIQPKTLDSKRNGSDKNFCVLLYLCVTSSHKTKPLAITHFMESIFLKLFQEWGEGRIKENDGGVNSTTIYCKNFCKCHNVPQQNNKNLKGRKEKEQGWRCGLRLELLPSKEQALS